MFNFTPATAKFRPGISGGSYPERLQKPENMLDKMSHYLTGFVKSANVSKFQFNQIIASIHHHGQALKTLDDESLSQKIRITRQELHCYGLKNDLIRQAFAVIREIASRTINMRHFDSQLMGGWVMIQGGLAEMETGEGKTLTATLAAATAALAGIPVHIVTVNDYLVVRDATLMEPIYTAMGLSVSTVTSDMDESARRKAYTCNITYCTNKQLAFDYLRDRILLGNDSGRLKLKFESLHDKNARIDRLFLRGLCFAIIDEADSVLIDEARTPLVISRKSDTSSEEQLYLQAMKIAETLQIELDFAVEYTERRARLSEKGKELVADAAKILGGIWSGSKRREELVSQALSAKHIYQRDHHYILQNNKVIIIDENTGRIMADRSWEYGLHQMIEIKEECELTGRLEHLARLTYQRFFRRYLNLAGMTGTAREVRRELWSTYHLPVVRVPSHKPCQRQKNGQRIYSNKQKKWEAVISRIRKLNQQNRPILIGTRSVADSECLSYRLSEEGIFHRVLNARQNTEEADIIAMAGEKSSITVATNMAGRGTDIPLGQGVAKIGGLHIIITERNDSRRIDRQLYGRCGRQGDPGSYEYILSLEDGLIREFLSISFKNFFVHLLQKYKIISMGIVFFVVDLAQSARERHHHRMRHDLLQADEQLAKLLAFSGRME